MSFIAVLILAAIAAVVVGIVLYEPEPEPIDPSVTVLPRGQVRASEPPTVRFTDVTASAGIDFVHENGATGEKLLPETMGPGCAVFDFDGDRALDILFVNARRWSESDGLVPADPGSGARSSLRLYRGDGKGQFTDVTRESGLSYSLYGMGAAVGDYDADGDPDVFVTSVFANVLFRNEGGRFENATATAGVAGDSGTWSTSAGFFDGDGDGDLDLFVCNYVEWSPELDAEIGFQLTGIGRAYGPPTHFAGTQPYYYRNRGDGTFEEAAAESGFHQKNSATGAPVAKALAILPFDFDGDGAVDVMVANDTVRNFLFHNRGDGSFEEIGGVVGVAYDAAGAATGAMGIDAAYYRGDHTIGIGVGNFATEMSSLYVSEGGELLFSDEAIAEGIGPVSRKMLSFGLFFFDYDLDGRQDLFQTNGHLEDEINKVQPSQQYRQPSQLFWNCGPEFPSAFVPVDLASAGDLGVPVVGRAAAYGDFDADGDLDLVITQTRGRPLLLRNDRSDDNAWLRIRLLGRAPNRDAIGARVEVDAGGVTQRLVVMPTRSYLAQVELTLTFGLGSATAVDEVRVIWPGEKEPQGFGALELGKLHELRQSER